MPWPNDTATTATALTGTFRGESPLWISLGIDHHSLGTKIHSSMYNSRPAPAQINNAAKSSRHTQASIPVDRAIPPHTPPIDRAPRLRRKAFTTDASGSLE